MLQSHPTAGHDKYPHIKANYEAINVPDMFVGESKWKFQELYNVIEIDCGKLQIVIAQKKITILVEPHYTSVTRGTLHCPNYVFLN